LSGVRVDEGGVGLASSLQGGQDDRSPQTRHVGEVHRRFSSLP
jgi:hypothetical protein